MRNDAIDVKVNKGLLAFGAEEEGAVGGVEGGGEGIGPGVATGGVGAPAAGGEPAVAPAGGIPPQVVMK